MKSEHPDDGVEYLLQEECTRLRLENDRLRRLLVEQGIEVEPPPEDLQSELSRSCVSVVTRSSDPDAKISLFRSLFRGREDVFAVRWESLDGRSGYHPKAQRDWKAYLASKPENRRKVDRETRRLLPLTNEVLRQHLVGEATVGIYPLLSDETCWFLAVDFDKRNWQWDAAAFLGTCRKMKVPAALERSRSGTGAHVWIFFEHPIVAAMARKLGSAILTRTMQNRHQLGLDSYDRLFPNQDTMPKGGFGNLIALPLQRAPREAGNAVFVDENFHAFPDQWVFLAGIQRMSVEGAEKWVHKATKKGEVLGVRVSRTNEEEQDPWICPPSKKTRDRPIRGLLPSSVQIVRANLLYIEKEGLPEAMMDQLLRLAAFRNPEFYKAQAMRLSTFGKPRVIACGEDLERYIALPRGCWNEMVVLLRRYSIEPRFREERFYGSPVQVNFHGRLRPLQQDAVRKVLASDDGVLSAPTAFGKTAAAAYVIAKRQVNTLVLVHRRQLLDQWREMLAMFLALPVTSIGQVGAGRKAPTGTIDVALIQSLYRKGTVKDLVAGYGQVIVDECHHISAFTFEQVLRQAKARYVLGLTATPTRKDGHHPIVYMQCGPIRFSLSARSMTEITPFDHEVIPRFTDFRFEIGESETRIHEIYAALIEDERRNDLIVNDLVEAVNAGRSPLLLTGRVKHLSRLTSKLSDSVQNLFVLKGGMGKKQQQATTKALSDVPENEQRVILATGSYLGEGFDDARLDTLFLAMPISWRGTLQQYVGRLHRLHDGKRVVQVYDFIDVHVPMLARMYERRSRGYRALGYAMADGSVPSTKMR